MITLHFIRPWWFLAFIPLLAWWWFVKQERSARRYWEQVCDPALLPYLFPQRQSPYQYDTVYYLAAAICTLLALTGPAFQKNPELTYHTVHPVLIIADLSEGMRQSDLSPNRWKMQQFKIRDILASATPVQYGLVAFSGEAFTVAPMTEDPAALAHFVEELHPDIMPAAGYALTNALDHGVQLMRQSGFQHGQIVVITGETPNPASWRAAARWHREGFDIAILPMRAEVPRNPRFDIFAQHGGGQVLSLTLTKQDMKIWIEKYQNTQYDKNQRTMLPRYRDEGRWLLVAALLCLLPCFRRGIAQEICA